MNKGKQNKKKKTVKNTAIKSAKKGSVSMVNGKIVFKMH